MAEPAPPATLPRFGRLLHAIGGQEPIPAGTRVRANTTVGPFVGITRNVDREHGFTTFALPSEVAWEDAPAPEGNGMEAAV